VVGGKLDRSTSTCLVPGGTLLIHRSSFRSMFNTGTDKLLKKKKKENQILHIVILLLKCLNNIHYYSVLHYYLTPHDVGVVHLFSIMKCSVSDGILDQVCKAVTSISSIN